MTLPLTGAGPSAGGWDPTKLSGLQLWLKADAGTWQDAAMTTAAASDGDAVGGWADQSGNSNDITQATAANKFTLKLSIQNSLPVLRSDGGDYLQGALGSALSQPFTVFAVAQLDASVVNDDSSRCVLDGDDVSNRMIMFQGNIPSPDGWAIFGGSGSGLYGNDSNANWNIWAALFNGASSQFWHNGTSEASGSTGTNNPDGVTVGAIYDGSLLWKGDVGEIIIYDPSLSTADRQTVESYLSVRWGISLP